VTTEKRRFTRVATQIKVILTVSGETLPVSAIEDIGVGGCRLRIQAQLPEEADCRLELQLGEEAAAPRVLLEGRLRRQGPGGTVVQFVAVDPRGLFHLQNLVRYNAPDADRVEGEIKDHPGLK